MRLRQTQTETVGGTTADLGAYAGAGSGRRRGRTRQMNPRQRQGLLLLTLAAAGMVAVFVLISSYVSSVSRRVGPMVDELVLSHPLKAYAPVTSADLSFRREPAKWAGPNVLTSETAALGLVSSTPLDASTVLQKGMLGQGPQVPAGDDEFALYLGAESAVAGQVQTGDSVDIVGTFGSSSQNAGVSKVVVGDVKVLDVGTPAATGSSSGSNTSGSIPVLLALNPHQMLLVEGAKSWASDLSLALLGPAGTHGGTPAPVSEGNL